MAAYDAVASAAYDAVASELVSDVHLASDVHLVPDVTNVARKARRYVHPRTSHADGGAFSEVASAAYGAVASAAYDAVASELVSDVCPSTNVARKVRRYVEPQTRSTDLERLSETDAAPGILDGP